MSSPVETIADALIAFILSLLRDPEAAAEFVAEPEAAMFRGGVGDICADDVRAVAPVIVDHPEVTPKPPAPEPGPHPNPVVKEIVKLVSQFTTIDNRSTIIDQSVNQNIWTEGGDVTQIFDQEAVVASGDEAVAAGNDATLTNTDTDITTGDVSIGNSEYNDSYNNTIDGSDNSSISDSFQDNSTNDASNNGQVNDSFQDNSSEVEIEDSNVASPVSGNDVDANHSTVVASVEEPADVLESDMTADFEAYSDSDSGAAVAEEIVYEEVPEDS